MKQFFIFLCSGLCVNTYATIRTVNNYVNSLAQYTTIQAAVDASTSGDTIYVHGSNVQYAAFTVTDKRLTILGAGWAPVKNYLPYKSTVASMTFSGIGCDNSEVQGLVFTSTVNCNFN